MNSRAEAILLNPEPCAQIVYPYTNQSQVIDAVRLFASAGLRKDEAVLLLMAETHSGRVLERLENDGFDVENLTKSDRLICEDVRKLLSSLMFDGKIDESQFTLKIGAMIQRARAARGARGVRVFGEMVNLMWQSDVDLERLENLWNKVIREHSVPLLCAYTLTGR